MYTTTPNRILPKQLLETQYSKILFRGFDEHWNEMYEKVDIQPSETLPTIEEIIYFSNDELVRLAHKIAAAYRFSLLSANENQKKLIIYDLPFNIKLKKPKNSTIDSLALRISDKKWWRRQIIKLADEKREHLAHLKKELGGKNATQVCCTDRTIEMHKERKKKTDKFLMGCNKIIRSNGSDAFVFNLLDVANGARKNRLNELFLDIKALERIAEQNQFGCAFITLTASPEFHPNPKIGRDKYSGASAREANRSLQKDWRSILDALDNIGVDRRSGDYFGFRVVEVHEDGCPHWHIAIFFNKELEILEAIEDSIERLYIDRKDYFANNKRDIVRIIEKTGDDTATPSSYIFGYVLKALAGEDDDTATRYKCAIRAMGARQYSFFGIKCATGKQRALKRVAKDPDAPTHIKQLAKQIHPPMDLDDRNESQLTARVHFFENDSDKLNFEKEEGNNKYGEVILTAKSIKHELDEQSVQIAGLCEDISQEQADKLRRKETEQVTIVINYSRKAKRKKRHARPLTKIRIWKRFCAQAASEREKEAVRRAYSAARSLSSHKGSIHLHPQMIRALAALEERRVTRYKTAAEEKPSGSLG
ncbi:replication endonuclease [Pseudomonas sp. SWRI22]|jgi:hypothetical protein|nr:replication endonuclease [Pseudomonas sp. SWRI22]MBV4509532.1 replication endonuclease [Pseudomonas sp. SWRI22]